MPTRVVCNLFTRRHVEVVEVWAVLTETLGARVSDLDTLGEDELLNVRAVETELSVLERERERERESACVCARA